VSNKFFPRNGVPPLPEPTMALLPLFLPLVVLLVVGVNDNRDMEFIPVLPVFNLIFVCSCISA
jgi:hypothetical protein